MNNKRLHTLREVIPSVDQPLRIYCEGLGTVVQQVYINQYLRTEEAALDNYYKDYIRDLLNSKARTEGNSALSLTHTLINLDDRWNAEKDKLQNKKDLAYSYIALLGAITTSHGELAQIYSRGEKPSEQKLNKILETNTKALKNFVEKAQHLP